MDTTTLVRASCHCKSNTFTLTLPTASLPLAATICDCTSCHRITGSFFLIYAVIPHPLVSDPAHPPSPDFKEYRSSENLTRYFCSKCGAHLAALTHDTGEWGINAGILERADGIYELKECIFAADNRDAGLLAHLAADFPRYVGWNTSARFSPPPPGTLSAKTRDTLGVRCHCGNVQATIRRPSHAAVADDVKARVLAASGADKWLAEHDLCTSCRTTSGFPCASWGAISVTHIAVAPSTRFARYKSSANVERLFCGTCGARAFFTGGQNPGQWDVALGVVDTEDQPVGAFLGEWFEWKREVLYAEDAVDSKFGEMLVRGLEAL